MGQDCAPKQQLASTGRSAQRTRVDGGARRSLGEEQEQPRQPPAPTSAGSLAAAPAVAAKSSGIRSSNAAKPRAEEVVSPPQRGSVPARGLGRSAPPAADRAPGVGGARPKWVTEMEKRAQEHRRIQEERREWHRQRQEAKAAAEKEAGEAKQRAEEEEQRQLVLERQERELAERRQKALKQVQLAQQREKMRQAKRFWVLQLLVRAWCGLQEVLVEAEEARLLAWRRYRRSLLQASLRGWNQHHAQHVVIVDVAWCARTKIALRISKRRLFRMMVSALRTLAATWEADAQEARRAVERGLSRRCVQRWRLVTTAANDEYSGTAMQQYRKWVSRYTLSIWKEGAKQAALETKFEEHKKMLRDKVSGWLREIDTQSHRIDGSLDV